MTAVHAAMLTSTSLLPHNSPSVCACTGQTADTKAKPRPRAATRRAFIKRPLSDDLMRVRLGCIITYKRKSSNRRRSARLHGEKPALNSRRARGKEATLDLEPPAVAKMNTQLVTGRDT